MNLGHDDSDLQFGEEAFYWPAQPGYARSAQILSLAEQLTSRSDDERRAASLFAAPGTPKLPYVDAEELRAVVRPGREKRRDRARKESPLHLHRRAAEGDVEAAIELVDDSLDDASRSARVAASSASIAIEIAAGVDADDISYRLLRPLVETVRASGDESEMADIMLEGLATRSKKSNPADTRVQERALRPQGLGAITPHGPNDELSIGVHGTFSRRGASPMIPSHRFYKSLRQNVTPSMYPVARGHFRWTSRYNAADRAQAADDLQRWTHAAGNRTRLDTVYAHSHGGNVVLEALSRQLISVGFLVLLSVPTVRRPESAWARVNAQVGRAVSYRAGFDPVIAVDRLAHNIGFRADATEPTDGPEFPSTFDVRQQPAVNTHRFGFSHSGWLDPRVWSHGLYSDLRYESELAAY